MKSGNLLGNETIISYLVGNTIWRDLGFDRDEISFRINPNDLVEIIRQFHTTIAKLPTPEGSATNFTYVNKKKKNKINKLTDEYFEYIQSESLPHFARIKRFLEDTRNEALRSMYHDTADEFKQKIITYRDRFETFDEVLTYLYDEIVSSFADGQGRRRLVRVFLHYMYCDCDIGRHA